MSHVDSKKTLACAVAAAIGFLAPASHAGAVQSQTFPSHADQAKRPAEPAAKERPKTPEVDEKSIAEKAAHYEQVHQERLARIRRLLAVYKEKGDAEKIAELQAMRDKLEKRHTNAMQKFREQLGEERWAKVEPHLRPRKVEREPENTRPQAKPEAKKGEVAPRSKEKR